MKCFVFMMLAMSVMTDGPDFDSAVLRLSGAGTMEELEEGELERYRSFYLHPLDLNAAGRGRLLSSGLLTAFQAASLLDWRERSGDILSYTELAMLDGFNEETAEALRCFTKLESAAPPGKRRSGGWRHDVMLRGAARSNLESAPEQAFGMRYRISSGEKVELHLAGRNTYGRPDFGAGTVSAAWYGRRAKVVLGHFNARFGQGLAVWSGFSMSPYGSVDSFRHSASGFSPTGSFSPEYCGAAADIDLGRWNAGLAYSFDGNAAIGSLSYCARRFSAGVTASGGAVSADFKLGFPGLSLYGEAAWKEAPSALAGLHWVPSYGYKAGLQLRWIKGVPELLAGASLKPADVVAAYSPEQFRLMGRYAPEIRLGRFGLKPLVRLAARKKGAWRLEGRGELHASCGPFGVSSRFDLVKCKSAAWLVNSEAGYSAEKFRCWLRATLFCVDDWDDRIYVYERDAPGSFNVPAYYGRGRALSFVGAWKFTARQAVYWRCSFIDYPWMTKYKEPRAEVKLQYQLRL